MTGRLSMLERAQCAQQLVMHCLTAGEPAHRPDGCHASGQELTQPPSGGRFGISARPPVHPWEAPGVLRAQHEVLHALHRREAPVQRLQRLPAAGLAVREETLLGMQGHVSRDHLSAAASPHRLQTTRVQVHGAGRLQHPVRAPWNTLEARPLAVRCSPMCMASAGLCHKPEGISCSQRLCALFCSHLGQAPEVQLCRVAPPAPHAMFWMPDGLTRICCVQDRLMRQVSPITRSQAEMCLHLFDCSMPLPPEKACGAHLITHMSSCSPGSLQRLRLAEQLRFRMYDPG